MPDKSGADGMLHHSAAMEYLHSSLCWDLRICGLLLLNFPSSLSYRLLLIITRVPLFGKPALTRAGLSWLIDGSAGVPASLLLCSVPDPGCASQRGGAGSDVWELCGPLPLK